MIQAALNFGISILIGTCLTQYPLNNHMAIDSRCFYFIGIQDSLEVNTIELEVDIRIINICNSLFKFFNTSVYPEYYSDY